LAYHYAVWITQVNEHPGLQLFIEDLDPTLDEPCRLGESRIILAIRDAVLEQERRWVRCVEGSLGSLTSAGAGPDAAASRVANAALLLREYVFPQGFTSGFHPTMPFATLARGETAVPLDQPWVIDSPQAWQQFWTAHAGAPAAVPPVDFLRDVVVVAAIGQRFEAGEYVEVRRVLPVGEGTLVQVVWR